MKNMINFDKILGNDEECKATIALTREEFEYILLTFTQALYDTNPYYAGRSHTLKEPKHKLFFVLHYLKTYPTFEAIAAQYDPFKQRTNIWLKQIIPILEKLSID